MGVICDAQGGEIGLDDLLRHRVGRFIARHLHHRFDLCQNFGVVGGFEVFEERDQGRDFDRAPGGVGDVDGVVRVADLAVGEVEHEAALQVFEVELHHAIEGRLVDDVGEHVLQDLKGGFGGVGTQHFQPGGAPRAGRKRVDDAVNGGVVVELGAGKASGETAFARDRHGGRGWLVVTDGDLRLEVVAYAGFVEFGLQGDVQACDGLVPDIFPETGPKGFAGALLIRRGEHVVDLQLKADGGRAHLDAAGLVLQFDGGHVGLHEAFGGGLEGEPSDGDVGDRQPGGKCRADAAIAHELQDQQETCHEDQPQGSPTDY